MFLVFELVAGGWRGEKMLARPFQNGRISLREFNERMNNSRPPLRCCHDRTPTRSFPTAYPLRFQDFPSNHIALNIQNCGHGIILSPSQEIVRFHPYQRSLQELKPNHPKGNLRPHAHQTNRETEKTLLRLPEHQGCLEPVPEHLEPKAADGEWVIDALRHQRLHRVVQLFMLQRQPRSRQIQGLDLRGQLGEKRLHLVPFHLMGKSKS